MKRLAGHLRGIAFIGSLKSRQPVTTSKVWLVSSPYNSAWLNIRSTFGTFKKTRQLTYAYTFCEYKWVSILEFTAPSLCQASVPDPCCKRIDTVCPEIRIKSHTQFVVQRISGCSVVQQGNVPAHTNEQRPTLGQSGHVSAQVASQVANVECQRLLDTTVLGELNDGDPCLGYGCQDPLLVNTEVHVVAASLVPDSHQGYRTFCRTKWLWVTHSHNIHTMPLDKDQSGNQQT